MHCFCKMIILMSHTNMLVFYFKKGYKRDLMQDILHIWKVPYIYNIYLSSICIHFIFLCIPQVESFWQYVVEFLISPMVSEINATESGQQKPNSNKLNFSYITSNCNAFFQNYHLYGVLIDHKIFCYFILQRGLKDTFTTFHIYGRHIYT